MLRKAGGDNAAALELGNLHPPKAGYVVHHVAARAIDRVGPENAGVRADAGDRVALRIDQIEVFAASVLGLGLLKERPRQWEQGIVRSIREIYLANDIARAG